MGRRCGGAVTLNEGPPFGQLFCNNSRGGAFTLIGVATGVVEAGGAAAQRAGDVDGDVPEPDARRALAGVADATYGLAVFADTVIVLADRAHRQHRCVMSPKLVSGEGTIVLD